MERNLLKIIIFVLFVALLLTSKHSDNEGYFFKVYHLIQENSVYRNNVDWQTLEEKYNKKIHSIKTRAELYGLIRELLRDLGDHHSHLVEPQKVVTTQTFLSIPPGKIIEGSIAYIQLPSFNLREGQEYVTQIYQIIESFRGLPLKGWIVDLRDNNGGNMWPMLASAAPFFPEGAIGSFLFPDQREVKWVRGKNGMYEGGSLQQPFCSSSPLETIPVAVLINQGTISAAEAVAIAFKGRKHTKFFGTASAGLTTSNEEYILSDGALLNLSTSYFASVDGEIFKGPIEPDVWAGEEEIIGKACRWLKEAPY